MRRRCNTNDKKTKRSRGSIENTWFYSKRRSRQFLTFQSACDIKGTTKAKDVGDWKWEFTDLK